MKITKKCQSRVLLLQVSLISNFVHKSVQLSQMTTQNNRSLNKLIKCLLIAATKDRPAKINYYRHSPAIQNF